MAREVVREVHRDFDGVCGAMAAAQLASLFAFLKSDQTGDARDDLTGLALHAEPAYWRHGLLSFCAKTCESKTAEVGGVPAFSCKRGRNQSNTRTQQECSVTDADCRHVIWTQSVLGQGRSADQPCPRLLSRPHSSQTCRALLCPGPSRCCPRGGEKV